MTTGNTHSSCHQSKSHCLSTVDLTEGLQSDSQITKNFFFFKFYSCTVQLKPCSSVPHRSYDTTLDYFINVSTACSPRSQPVGVHLEVGVFASLCQYFSESEKQWRTDGMVPLAETNASRAVCHTKHLTAFAAGLFVPANAISFKVPVSITKTHFFFTCR